MICAPPPVAKHQICHQWLNDMLQVSEARALQIMHCNCQQGQAAQVENGQENTSVRKAEDLVIPYK